MSNELKAMTDGTFTFSESEDPNVFYFYRNDGEVIGNVGRIQWTSTKTGFAPKCLMAKLRKW